MVERNDAYYLLLNKNHFINDPIQLVKGFDFPSAIWIALRRTVQGRCNYLIRKWGMADSPLYHCGQVQTVGYMLRNVWKQCLVEVQQIYIRATSKR